VNHEGKRDLDASKHRQIIEHLCKLQRRGIEHRSIALRPWSVSPLSQPLPALNNNSTTKVNVIMIDDPLNDRLHRMQH